VQKAPAATIGILAEALRRLLRVHNPVQVIGTRHGEKQYETLLTREEMAQAEDLGDYYCVPADNRDLNYNLYYSEGSPRVVLSESYHSHNTRQLNVDEMMALLLQLDEVRATLRTRGIAAP
jgi:UDP-glucose 4-epimerase